MKKISIILALVIIVSALAVGCGSSDIYISEDEAKTAVTEKAGGGTVEELVLGSVDGFKIYYGTVVNGADTYEFQVDAESGTVVNWLKNGESNKPMPIEEEAEETAGAAVTPYENTEVADEEYLSSSAAQAIVSAKYPSAFIEAVEFIEDGESLIYNITITDGGEPFTVSVDANLGTIIGDADSEIEE